MLCSALNASSARIAARAASTCSRNDAISVSLPFAALDIADPNVTSRAAADVDAAASAVTCAAADSMLPDFPMRASASASAANPRRAFINATNC